jgi:hypothetical protein
MQFRVAQVWILAIFTASLVLELCLVGVSFIRGAIYADDFRDLTVRFLAIYSVPLGVVISGIFAKSASSNHLAPARAFWTAVLLAAVWNALILGRTLLFASSAEDQVTSLVEFVTATAAASSFLTVASLTYFFTVKKGG